MLSASDYRELAGTIEHMQTPQPRSGSALALEFPQSLAVYDDYTKAQKAVDFLSDNEFPVQNCMIVGTDLKQVERITGRLTTGRVALAGALSGLWLGLLIGLIFAMFGERLDPGHGLRRRPLLGAIFGVVWAAGRLRRGPRAARLLVDHARWWPPATRCWSSTSISPRPGSCWPSCQVASPTRSPDSAQLPLEDLACSQQQPDQRLIVLLPNASPMPRTTR